MPTFLRKGSESEANPRVVARREAVARMIFAEAGDLFSAGKYKEAAERYQEAAVQWPGSPVEEDALYMMGESYFFADRYPDANKAFADLLKKHENSRYLAEASDRQFAIARYWQEMARELPSYSVVNVADKTRPWCRTQSGALATYESIRMNDPTGPLADDAIMAAGAMQFENGRYEDAAYHLELLRKDYPQSEHQPEAHLLGYRAHIESYQGPDYDATPLETAGKIVDQALIQFGPEMPGERERMIEARAAVEGMKAERDWRTGKYYAKNKFYGAARYYYERIVSDYSNTSFAELAEKELAAIQGKPDNPPQRLPWLTRLFSHNKSRW
jgi:outer membrane protein assembly factor BamD (BamD/ComL family)